MKGRDLQRTIIDAARRLGWKVAHTPPIPTERGWRTAVAADGKGFPDLLLVRDRVIVAEVKGETDRLRPEQQEWLSAFRMAGTEAYIWRTEDWENGAVEGVLRTRSVVGLAVVGCATHGGLQSGPCPVCGEMPPGTRAA